MCDILESLWTDGTFGYGLISARVNSPDMSHSPADIEQTVRAFLALTKKLPDDFEAHMPLYAEGVGLDSLETAELSATLEDAYGTDPWAAGTMPQNLAEILAYYDAVPAEA